MMMISPSAARSSSAIIAQRVTQRLCLHSTSYTVAITPYISNLSILAQQRRSYTKDGTTTTNFINPAPSSSSNSSSSADTTTTTTNNSDSSSESTSSFDPHVNQKQYDYGDSEDAAKKNTDADNWVNSWKPLRMLKEAVASQKEKLRFEIRNMPISEIRQFTATQGKVIVANQTLIPPNRALTIPGHSELLKTVQSLSALGSIPNGVTQKHFTDIKAEMAKCKVTLLCVAFVVLANDQNLMWLDPFKERYSSNRSAQYYDFCITEGMTYRIIQNTLNKNLLQQVPKDQHAHSLIWYASKEECYKFKTRVGIENSRCNYVFLCDSKGRVRWKASGVPTDEEMQLMYKMADQLIKEK